MKRFTSILMLSFALAGTAWAQGGSQQTVSTKATTHTTISAPLTQLSRSSQSVTTPVDGVQDGIYEIQNRGGNGPTESRGYMVYAPQQEGEHKNRLQIAGCKLNKYTSSEYSYTRQDDGTYESNIYGYWYLYTSANNKRYIFSLYYQDGKVLFLNKDEYFAAVVETPHSITIEQSTFKSAYKQIKLDRTTYYLSNSVGWRKVGFPMRWDSNTRDDAAPHSFETPTKTQELPQGLLDAAKQKVQEYESTVLNQKKEEITNWVKSFKGKVGYPKETVYETLTAELATANTFAEIDAAKKKFCESTDVNLPISGKAYTIKAHFTDGSEQALYWDGSAIKNGSNPEGNAAVFVCRQVGNKYFFTNNFGKYLIWFDSGDGNKSLDVKGAIDTYDATHNDWTLGRATVASGQSGSIQSGTTNETLFGLLQMQAADKSGRNQYYLAARKDGAFIAGNHSDKWYDRSGNSARSFVFHFEEVSYPNAADLKSIEGDAIKIGDATHIATFSAPFATEVPEGVKAYYVKADGVAADVAKVTAVGGNTIPANQGVLLTGKTAGTVTMLPATTAGTELTDNQLGHSAGAAKDLATEQTPFYILTKVGNKVGFFLGDTSKNTTLGMNKAYLKGKANSQAIRLVLDDVTTGVEETLTDAAAQLPVYDLSGRRAMQPLKKGIYIQGGKKFIVK